MRWNKKEVNEAIKLLKSGENYFNISLKLNRTKKSVKEKLNKLGYKQLDYVKVEKYRHQNCDYCDKEFKSLVSENRKFCSQSCSASLNNKKRNVIKECFNCGNILDSKRKKYCNHKCHKEYQKKVIFNKIENGDITLYFKQYKDYLIYKYSEKCMECGWSEVNPYSGNVPIELEHMDGNSSNNSLDNLKLLCPNHHSLTPTYKGLNSGNGRHSRRVRYNEGKSY